jgi:hypothetical protein
MDLGLSATSARENLCFILSKYLRYIILEYLNKKGLNLFYKYNCSGYIYVIFSRDKERIIKATS